MTVLEEIQRVASQYCQLYDDGQVEDLVDIFTDDACLTHQVGGQTLDLVITGREAIHAHYAQLVRSITYGGTGAGSRTMHCLVNPIIDVDNDAHTARASFDYFCLGFGADGIGIVSGGRFVFHRLVRDTDGWRIANLEFVINLDPASVTAAQQGA